MYCEREGKGEWKECVAWREVAERGCGCVRWRVTVYLCEAMFVMCMVREEEGSVA